MKKLQKALPWDRADDCGGNYRHSGGNRNPQFSEYTKKGENKGAQVDNRNFLTRAVANSQ